MKYLFLLLPFILSACTPSTSDLDSGAGGQQGFSKHYSAKLNNAIKLLKNRGWWKYVNYYLNGVIERTGNGYVNVGTGIMYADSRTTATQSTSWVASLFVHEARHVEQSHTGVTVPQETDAINKQLEACRTLGCSKFEVNWLNSLIGVHGA